MHLVSDSYICYMFHINGTSILGDQRICLKLWEEKLARLQPNEYNELDKENCLVMRLCLHLYATLRIHPLGLTSLACLDSANSCGDLDKET